MRCRQCGSVDTKVLDSRLSSEGRAVRRRRLCLECGYRFTTYEKEDVGPIQVRKKDERFEEFDRDKVTRAIKTACEKRPVPPDRIVALVTDIERRLLERGERAVDSRVIGDMVMDALRQLDQVAYVRFASVYKEFKSAEEFLSELTKLPAAATSAASLS